MKTQHAKWVEYGSLAALLVALGGLYLFLLKPDVAGFLYDDGMYLMAARALAEGEGYRLIGIAGQPFFYKYPPLYPLLLSGVWRLNPHFPENIVWLKLPGILLTLGSLGLLFGYARRIARLSWPVSLGVVALMGLNWRLIEVSIEMMSEPLWLVLSLFTLILAEGGALRGAPSEKNLPKIRLAGLIVLSALAFYTRTVGLMLMAAILLWMLRVGMRKAALVYGVGCGVLIAPWLLWSASRPDTTTRVGDFLVRSFQETYFQSMRMDLRYEYSLPDMLWKGLQEWLGNLSVQFFPLLERFFLERPTLGSEALILGLSSTLALLLGGWAWRCYRYRPPEEGAFAPSGLPSRFPLGPTGIYVALYLLMLSCWSFYKFYPRFIVVILPFLWIALIHAIRDMLRRFSSRARNGAVAGLISLGLLTEGIHLAPYLVKPHPDTLLLNASWNLWVDYEEAFAFLRQHTPPDAILYSNSGDESYFYALNAGRPTLDFFLFLPRTSLPADCESLSCLTPVFRARGEALHQVLIRARAAYIIVNDVAVIKNQYNNGVFRKREQSPAMMAIHLHPALFTPVFHSAHGVIRIYRLNAD